MISSLPGKALRMLFDIARLAEQFMGSQSRSGKLDIKRRKPGILFISIQAYSLFKLAFIT